ncbi:MAG TPA: hypothetical protein VEI52_11295 [Terriglobales bacterium]|nr:hypothetical protein [Terriglobales bacterium]
MKTLVSLHHPLRREHLQGDTPNPILFPFYDPTTIPGFLQLSFRETELVAAHQMQSCHVMANLMGEAVVRAAEAQSKQTLAKEHAVLIEALERLKPQLQRLTTDAAAPNAEVAGIHLEPNLASVLEVRHKSAAELFSEGLSDISNLLELLTAEAGSANATKNSPGALEQKDELKVPATSAPEVTGVQPATAAGSNGSESATLAQLSSACGQCGFLFSEGESFCGRCGTPRLIESSAFSASPAGDVSRPHSPVSESKRAVRAKVSR